MLDYLTANIAFWMTLFGVQESLLELRLGYLGRYWFLAISATLLLSFLLSAPITIALIIKFGVDPFTWTGNVILCAIAAVIFGVMLTFQAGRGLYCLDSQGKHGNQVGSLENNNNLVTLFSQY
ncbi:hypothetical protein LC613_39335 [Nostoc sphaeroides CHAB 2801]|uniref:hypothetical protein n=1 Tax=Nostoc sphaeroides TaxID=446679 RepID=UPI001E2BCCD0|nr:hypothetical protein [Nostoc sphaeroides]MCC5633517.1 hypothetical protein [Nostoc sphaeroides CHAB 2801]